jgi:hypothetical protein
VSIHEATSAYRLTAPPSRASFVAQRTKSADRGGAGAGLEAGGPSCGPGAGAGEESAPGPGRLDSLETRAGEARLNTRRLPPPWRAEKFSGGYVVRDANGFGVAYVYGRSTEDEAMEAKQMTMDEARRVASNIAKLPDKLNREDKLPDILKREE